MYKIGNYISKAEKGVANGVATLDAGSKLPVSQLPTSAMEYKGVWDASTNTPALASGTGTNGDYYLVSADGTTTLDGVTDWEIGDAVLFNGTLSVWQKVGKAGGSGGDASTVLINGKKDSAGTIAKGLPVYLVGYDSDLHTVELADANNSVKMPVIGFTGESFNNTDSKPIITYGKLEGVDTTSTVSQLNPNGETWVVNDVLYISINTGGLTKVRPTGSGSLIQRVAKVLKVDATGGQIFIFNTARTAGLPNLSQDNVWVGDANGYPQMVNKSTLGGNTIYTADDTVGSGRIATLTDTLSFKGSDTSVLSSNLKILDSASLTLWDFRNNGDVYIGQNTVFEGGAFGFVFNRTTGLNTLELQTNGANFATFRSALTEIASSVIHLGSLGGSNGLKIESDRVRYYTSVGGAGVIHDIHADRFALFGQGFSTPANSYFSIGSFTRIGTENVSLQGETFIKGNDTLSASTALAIYDGDTTPNKLWDFVNSGDVNLGQAVDINTSNTFNFVNGSREVGIASWNTHAYWGINNGTRRWDLISANSSSAFNADEFGIANGSSIPIRIFNNTSVALGNVNKVNLNTAYSVQTNGATLIGGNLDATDGANILQFDFNNYPKVKIGTASQEWWLIEGDGTGSVFNNGDLYIYDSTGATKLVQFKQSGGGILLGGTLDMDNNRITNTVINPSVQETTSTATFTINADEETMGVLTAMAAATTIAAPTGTPVQGQRLMLRFKDDGTSRALTWNAVWRAIGVTLPTATTANKTLYVGAVYNSTDSKWDVIAVKEEA